MPLQFGPQSGRYRLVGLAPGVYEIAVEPMDGPGLPLRGGVFGTASGGESFVPMDFLATFLPNPIAVQAGQIVQTGNLSVRRKSPAAPNLAPFSFTALPGGPFRDPAMALPGSQVTLSIGLGENLVTNGVLVPGTEFTFRGGDISVGSPMVRSTDILLPLTVPPEAAPGPRLLVVTTASGVSVFPGGLIVVPPARVNVALRRCC